MIKDRLIIFGVAAFLALVLLWSVAMGVVKFLAFWRIAFG